MSRTTLTPRRVVFSSCSIFAVAIVTFLLPINWSPLPDSSELGRQLHASPQSVFKPLEGNAGDDVLIRPARPATTAQPAVLKAKREEAARDAVALADLAQALKNDIVQANANVLPISYVERAEKIEKLAKRIKNWAKSS